MNKVVDYSHYVLTDVITKLDVTIDCTMGTGKDTLFLGKLSRIVYSFDIQEKALEQTKKLLEDNDCNNVVLIKDGHENLDKYVNEKVSAIMFNLGYLPNGDKTITTQIETTLIAINKGLNLLKIGGLMSIVVYPGHPQGKIESEKLLEYLQLLNQKEYDVLRYEYINWKNNPSYLILIRKK